MSDEKPFQRRKPARLRKVRELTRETPGPVRIICIVVESQQGMALVQDIMDDVGQAGSIRVTVPDTLDVAKKYILLGEVTEKTGSDETELLLAVSIAQNINELDIKELKQAIALEREVMQSLSR